MQSTDEMEADETQLEAEAWRALARAQRAELVRIRQGLKGCHATMIEQQNEIFALKAQQESRAQEAADARDALETARAGSYAIEVTNPNRVTEFIVVAKGAWRRKHE